MSISEKLTQQKLLEILLNIYRDEKEFRNREARDVITELKQQILSLTSN
jgi:hypothetical protein